MARARNKSSKSGNFSFKGYVTVNLDRAMKQSIADWELSADDIFNYLEKLTDSGYKVSLGHDERNACESVNITATSVGEAINGYVLSGRGGSLYDAMRSALYKHYTVLEEDWTMEVGRSYEDGDIW